MVECPEGSKRNKYYTIPINLVSINNITLEDCCDFLDRGCNKGCINPLIYGHETGIDVYVIDNIISRWDAQWQNKPRAGSYNICIPTDKIIDYITAQFPPKDPDDPEHRHIDNEGWDYNIDNLFLESTNINFNEYADLIYENGELEDHDALINHGGCCNIFNANDVWYIITNNLDNYSVSDSIHVICPDRQHPYYHRDFTHKGSWNIEEIKKNCINWHVRYTPTIPTSGGPGRGACSWHNINFNVTLRLEQECVHVPENVIPPQKPYAVNIKVIDKCFPVDQITNYNKNLGDIPIVPTYLYPDTNIFSFKYVYLDDNTYAKINYELGDDGKYHNMAHFHKYDDDIDKQLITSPDGNVHCIPLSELSPNTDFNEKRLGNGLYTDNRIKSNKNNPLTNGLVPYEFYNYGFNDFVPCCIAEKPEICCYYDEREKLLPRCNKLIVADGWHPEWYHWDPSICDDLKSEETIKNVTLYVKLPISDKQKQLVLLNDVTYKCNETIDGKELIDLINDAGDNINRDDVKGLRTVKYVKCCKGINCEDI
jgi:hypothetical protein